MNRYPIGRHLALAAKAGEEEKRSERERTLQLARLALLGKLVDKTGILWSVDVQTRIIQGQGPVEYGYLCSPMMPVLESGSFTFVLIDLLPDHVDCQLIELRAELVLDLWKISLQREGLSDKAIAAIMYSGGNNA